MPLRYLPFRRDGRILLKAYWNSTVAYQPAWFDKRHSLV
jgi:hypothetical protein